MPVMEISIKWNICRVCLAEEGQNHNAKYILIDSKIVKQVYDITGVQMETSDNQPDKICRKCLLLLKYAYHFRTTCRNSEEYLQSVIQKTKSATSMLKMDKQRERSVELLEEIFHEDVEFISLSEQRDPETEEYFDTKEDSLPSQLALSEKIGDSRDSTKPHFTSTTPSMSLVSKKQEYHRKDSPMHTASYEESNDDKKNHDNNVDLNSADRNINNKHDETTAKQKFIGQDDEESEVDGVYRNRKTNYKQRHLQTPNRKLSKAQKEPNCSEQILTAQDSEEDELADFDDSKTNSKQNPLRLQKTKYTTESSVDTLDYADDNKIGDEDIVDENNDYNSNNSNKEDDIDNSVDTEIRIDKLKTSSNSPTHESETKQQTEEELYYLIEEPVKTEESPNSQIEDVELDVNTDDGIQLIDNYEEIDGCEEGEEPEYIDPETPRSVVQIEEYLIDEIETESVLPHELELSEDQLTKRPSSTTIKIRDRASPHIRRKGNDSYLFSCDVCGNHFTSRSLRNYHMRIHRKEKNFECELCFKRFTAACNLTAHMRIHTGEKPYECKYCLRRFTDRSTHVKHERIHTNEKPFQCNICGKSFALSTTLRTHEKVHTNEKPFKCEPCEKSFKLPHQLKSHLLTNQHKNIVTANELGNYN